MSSNIPRDGSPSIVITCGRTSESPRRRELYVEAVEKAGGNAVFASPGSRLSDLADHHDGFIIPGGRDIDPLFYGENKDYPIVPEEAARTDFEFSLLREIIGKNKPVLGICYGMQLINIFFKGSLYQDLPLQVAGSMNHSSGEHDIIIGDNPFLEIGEGRVNSSHHQAVKEVGKGLRPFARAHDGIIEAIYAEGCRFIVGVQWHPERIIDPLSARLFERFLGACGV